MNLVYLMEATPSVSVSWRGPAAYELFCWWADATCHDPSREEILRLCADDFRADAKLHVTPQRKAHFAEAVYPGGTQSANVSKWLKGTLSRRPLASRIGEYLKQRASLISSTKGISPFSVVDDAAEWEAEAGGVGAMPSPSSSTSLPPVSPTSLPVSLPPTSPSPSETTPTTSITTTTTPSSTSKKVVRKLALSPSVSPAVGDRGGDEESTADETLSFKPIQRAVEMSPFAKLSVDEVAEWVEASLPECAELPAQIVQHAIDGSTLLQLNEADLKELGISQIGVRKKLIRAIASAQVPLAEASQVKEFLSRKDAKLQPQQLFLIDFLAHEAGIVVNYLYGFVIEGLAVKNVKRKPGEPERDYRLVKVGKSTDPSRRLLEVQRGLRGLGLAQVRVTPFFTLPLPPPLESAERLVRKAAGWPVAHTWADQLTATVPTRKPSYLSVIGKEEYVISAVSYIYYLHVHLERCMDVQSVLTDNLAPIHIESADLEYGDLHVSIASQQQQQ